MSEHGALIAALILGAGLLILAVLAWLDRRRTNHGRAVVADAIAKAEAAEPTHTRHIPLTAFDRRMWHGIDTYIATHDSTGEDHL